MTTTKRLICLANSRKLAGYCVAGKEKTDGTWVRPVTSRPNQEVSAQEQRYSDGTYPRVLDIVDIPVLQHQPNTYQSENWLLDVKHSWTKVDQLTWKDVSTLADNPSQLWINGFRTFNGMNDRVPVVQAQQLPNSLFFLHVNDMVLHVFAPGEAFSNPKRRVLGSFSHRGIPYRFWVTDPSFEQEYLAKKDGDYIIGECFVTVSLGEPKDGYCYKLIAAIITPDP